MKVVRHCRERLPGGEAKWQRLSKLAGFDGKLCVFGYGTGPRAIATQQRRIASSDSEKPAIIGEYDHDARTIRVWMASPCASAVEFRQSPLFTFAHELGHFRFRMRGHPYHGKREEESCDRYAYRLLKEVQNETPRRK